MHPPVTDAHQIVQKKEGVDVDPASIADVDATFPGYSCVNGMSTIETTFLEEKNIVPIR